MPRCFSYQALSASGLSARTNAPPSPVTPAMTPPCVASHQPYPTKTDRKIQAFAPSTVALRCATASIEIMGLTPDALGNDEPSITYKFFTPQASPSGFVAETLGESPSRAVPMMWKENNASCALPQ